MASRNIASMHLFLEMKKVFPDLPEDMIRNYSCLYAEDQEKCAGLLEKESKSYFQFRSQFLDGCLQQEGKMKPATSDEIPSNLNLELKNSNMLFFQNHVGSSGQQSTPSPTSPSGGLLHLPSVPSNLNVSLQMESNSNQAHAGGDKKSNAISSQTHRCQIPDQNDNRMMFSTTQEHQISAVGGSSEPSQKHAVSLNITPSFPFSQQPVVGQNGSAQAPALLATSRTGRHTTSINFHLQSPHCSDSRPLEISSVPTDIRDSRNHQDFGSHVQISVGSQGATFTALRLQRPNNNCPPYQLSLTEQPSEGILLGSSCQTANFRIPVHQVGVVNSDRGGSEVDYPNQGVNLSSAGANPGRETSAQTSFMHGYQASPDYIAAVKKHQLARLQLVREEVSEVKQACSKLQQEVNKRENQLVLRKEREKSISHAELLQRLKEENRKLQVECNCLLMEYDLCSKGQIPVGMTDEDFYSNIFTGPDDGLTLLSSNGKRAGSKDPASEDSDDDKWRCKSCTFANHPFLEKCEMCELPKNSGSFFNVD